MQAFALRHRTSKRYLHLEDEGAATEHPDAARASIWYSREGAEQAHMALGSFASCWGIAPIERPLSDADADKMLAALREEGL